jgi:hypothetical protein
MMQLLMLLGLLAVPASAGDKTISNVVSMLQEMLDKSKADGENDRKVYGEFKCFCDTKLEEKDESITVTQADVDSAEAQLADLRAENTKLSQEVAGLEKDIADNEKMREEASTLRDQEKEAFATTEADLETGIGQLERAIELLAAVGADQTVSGDTDGEMPPGSETKGAFLTREREFQKRSRKAMVEEVRHDVEDALRAASFFVRSHQGPAADTQPLQKVKAFLQAPFTGNYNAQSGEIVGILKNMNDTFTMNLVNARKDEEKAQTAYDEMVEVKTKEHEEMTAAFESKKQLIGDNAENIGTTTTEVQSMKEQLDVDTTFRDSLLEKCPKKAEEYKIRTSLRANEEAAIAQAIAILDKVASHVSKTSSSDKLSLLQLTQKDEPGEAPPEVIRSLMRAAGRTHSFRIAHIAAALENPVKNPFSKVLEMIDKTISLIDAEEADDEKYHAWCETEQTENEESKSEKETNLETLETSISELEIALQSTKDSIETGTSDLKSTRETKTQAIADRKEENKQFSEELSNFESALSGLAEAKKVLTEFYEKLAEKNKELEEKAALLRLKSAETGYRIHVLKDSPGGKLMQVKGMVSIAKLKQICTSKPDCVAFNSKGWLLSSLAPEADWYHWSGGNLYVKQDSDAPAPRTLLQRDEPLEGEPDASLSTAGEGSDKVLEMLEFVAEEVSKEKDVLLGNEQSAQSAFEEEMQGIEAEESTLEQNLDQYALNKANQEKAIEEAHDDITTTTKEKMAIEFYLEKIEPGCTFIQTNFETRKTNRAAEKAALEDAVEMLKGTPAFIKAEEAAEKAAMGKCAGICEEKGKSHAECAACLNGVSVFGYCSSPKNADAPGCVDATKTSSADALK